MSEMILDSAHYPIPGALRKSEHSIALSFVNDDTGGKASNIRSVSEF